ncbi:CRPV-123 [Crowpox virus]|nr:CRPV-123 [Crowpox virus]
MILKFIISSRKDIDSVLAKFHEITNYKYDSVYQRFCYKLHCNRMGCYNKTITFRNVQETKLKSMIKKVRGLTIHKIYIQPEND